MRRIIPSLVAISVLCFAPDVISGDMLDEFSAIYHSSAIIEVAVTLDRYGQPRDCYYVKTIKGKRSELADIYKTFGIKRGNGGKKARQKRLMFFYRNGRGALRSMDLIRQGTGPYSDSKYYKSFVDMVSLLSRELDRDLKQGGERVILAGEDICKALRKNTYFNNRYGYVIEDGRFSVGGDAGDFAGRFAPLVRIECPM